MLLTVALNPALDLTYVVAALVPGSAMRVTQVHQRTGGKAVNVARVAAAYGGLVCATGLAGGARGQAVRAALGEAGIRDEFEPIAGETRQTVTIVDSGRGGHPTELREPGPTVTADEWTRFQGRYARLAAEASVVVLSGSLPPGVPEDAYATLTSTARAAGPASVIVDAGGAALRLACAAGPDIVNPNERELLAASGDGTVAGAGAGSGSGSGARAGRADRVLAAAESLRQLGASAVVASLGPTGSVAVTAAGRWRVRQPRLAGNPVGAGDALVAGLALGCARAAAADRTGAGRTAADRTAADWTAADWARVLAQASGLAMASVLSPTAGEVDPAEAARLAGQVRIRKIGTFRS